VTYADEAPIAHKGGGARVQSSNRLVSGAAIAQPWELKFKPASNNRQRLSARAANDNQLLSASAETDLIQEAAISPDEVTRLLSVWSLPEFPSAR
jgi:hypothetical protein